MADMKTLLIIFFCGFALTLDAARALSIVWDYTYDTGGFFTQDKKDVLAMVASRLNTVSVNSTAINPSGLNTWSWLFTDPTSGGSVTVTDPTANAGEVRVYVGARSLAGPLALGGGVGYSAAGTQTWLDTISNRNTTQAFKPYAGVITFDTAQSWYTGILDSVDPLKFDFYSVASHELAHVLGFTTGVNAWVANSNQPAFLYIGSNATASYGANVPLHSGLSHWASGTQYGGHDMLMVPAIASGVRNDWTAPEFGVLKDLGYVVIPEPAMAWLILCGILLCVLRTRNRTNRWTLRD